MQSLRFDPKAYGSVVSALLAETRLSELGPGSPEPGVRVELQRFDPDADLGRPIRNRDAARACLAGLWLYFDYLDESHTISQELNTAEGSFWHAIMHRREPDASNSKYWWRLAGLHPVLSQLATRAPTIGYNYSTSQDFVDFCERVRGTGNQDESIAMQVQLLEWQLLFDYCFSQAIE